MLHFILEQVKNIEIDKKIKPENTVYEVMILI